MKRKTTDPCEAVVLVPVKSAVPRIPPYPDAKAIEQPFTLDDRNDPQRYRCEMAIYFGGDIKKARWKRYQVDTGWREAYSLYKGEAKKADWGRRLDDATGEALAMILYGKKINDVDHYLLVFVAPHGDGASVLAGYRLP